MSEDYILWHDWPWVEGRIKQIDKAKREDRRWNLARTLASVSGGTNGGDSIEYWQDLMESLVTDEEALASQQEQIRQLEEELAEQRRIEALAQSMADAKGTVALTTM